MIGELPAAHRLQARAYGGRRLNYKTNASSLHYLYLTYFLLFVSGRQGTKTESVDERQGGVATGSEQTVGPQETTRRVTNKEINYYLFIIIYCV